jgi:Family of unknown function (DUF6011)
MQVNSEFTDVPVLHPHSHRFASMADAKLFATAGNATITLESIKTGVHYTYKVRESKAVENSTKAPVHFVSLLTGPDNENDFKYLGLIVPNRYLLTITKASKLSTGSAPVLAFNYFWSRPDGAIPSQLAVYHSGRCGRCNRTLTTPESITRGIGPDCSELMGLDL